jgi:uncharacterized protein
MNDMRAHDLLSHPEGGAFREIFRSPLLVNSADGRERSALTHIYFRLRAGEVSRFHRVASDEIWNRYQGSLRLWLWDGNDSAPRAVILDEASAHFCEVVPAGCWQAAEPLSEEVLVGCSVAPGFDYADFELMHPTGAQSKRLLALRQDLQHLI